MQALNTENDHYCFYRIVYEQNFMEFICVYINFLSGILSAVYIERERIQCTYEVDKSVLWMITRYIVVNYKYIYNCTITFYFLMHSNSVISSIRKLQNYVSLLSYNRKIIKIVVNYLNVLSIRAMNCYTCMTSGIVTHNSRF